MCGVDKLKWSAFLLKAPWASDTNDDGTRRGGTESQTGQRAADEFEGALLIVGVLATIVLVHATASNKWNLPLAVRFPTVSTPRVAVWVYSLSLDITVIQVEFYLVKLVFGALAVASALVPL